MGDLASVDVLLACSAGPGHASGLQVTAAGKVDCLQPERCLETQAALADRPEVYMRQ